MIDIRTVSGDIVRVCREDWLESVGHYDRYAVESTFCDSIWYCPNCDREPEDPHEGICACYPDV